jgi:hypothetical protein
MNGSITKELLKNESFKNEIELDIMKIIDSKEPSIDPPEIVAGDRNENREDAIDNPDIDLINVILDKPAKEAAAMVKDVLKIATIFALKESEKRTVVRAAIEAQIKKLTQ